MYTSKSHYCQEAEQESARRLNKGKFCLLFSLVFAGYRKGLSTENLLFRREGMAD